MRKQRMGHKRRAMGMKRRGMKTPMRADGSDPMRMGGDGSTRNRADGKEQTMRAWTAEGERMAGMYGSHKDQM